MLQEFVLSGAKEAAEEVDAMKEPADTSRAEETVSLPLPSLRDSDRFPTPTRSRCRHGSTFLSPVWCPGPLETTAASTTVAIEACPFAPESVITVAVGTIITDRPPHRSVRARLRIRLLRRMSGIEACIGIGVQNAGWRNPPVQDWGKAFPTHPCALAAADQNTLP